MILYIRTGCGAETRFATNIPTVMERLMIIVWKVKVMAVMIKGW